MESVVKDMPGYISHFSQRDPITRNGVTVSYFESREAIKTWREHPQHKITQELTHTHFDSWYDIQIVKIKSAQDWQN